MKVLLIEEVSGYGGSTVCALNLLRLLPIDRYEKSLIVYFHDDVVFDRNTLGLQNVYVLEKKQRYFKLSILNKLSYILEGVRRIIKSYFIILKERPDIIHLNNSLGINFYSIIASKLSGIPCVVHVRNFEELHTIQRIAVRYVSKIIAISQCVYDFMDDNVRAKATVIYDGLLNEEISPTSNSFSFKKLAGMREQDRVVGFVGMLNRWKGVDVFIRAFRTVASCCTDVVGVIFGDEIDDGSGYKDELVAMVKDLGLDGRLIFAGLRKDINEIYPSLDVVVHASVTPEPFGRVIIEAMAAARPVVATNIGGPKELIVNGVTGILYEPGNHIELAEIITSLLREPHLAFNMGRAAQEYVRKNFRIHETVLQTSKVYEDVASH